MKYLKRWYVYLFRGILAILFTALLLVGGGLQIGTYMGVFWIAVGLSLLPTARTDEGPIWLEVIVAVLTILGGAVVLSYPLLDIWMTWTTLTSLIGAMAICLGILHVLGASRIGVKLGPEWAWGGLLLGLLEIGLGVMVLRTPGILTQEVVFMFAAWGALAGIILILNALRLRRAQ